MIDQIVIFAFAGLSAVLLNRGLNMLSRSNTSETFANNSFHLRQQVWPEQQYGSMHIVGDTPTKTSWDNQIDRAVKDYKSGVDPRVNKTDFHDGSYDRSNQYHIMKGGNGHGASCDTNNHNNSNGRACTLVQFVDDPASGYHRSITTPLKHSTDIDGNWRSKFTTKQRMGIGSDIGYQQSDVEKLDNQRREHRQKMKDISFKLHQDQIGLQFGAGRRERSHGPKWVRANLQQCAKRCAEDQNCDRFSWSGGNFNSDNTATGMCSTEEKRKSYLTGQDGIPTFVVR